MTESVRLLRLVLRAEGITLAGPRDGAPRVPVPACRCPLSLAYLPHDLATRIHIPAN